jgi:hypothetical protein
MDAAVNEHASILGCISYKEASVIDEIARLRSKIKGSPIASLAI